MEKTGKMEKKLKSEARLHAIVHGRVQGVNFRYYTVRTAQRLGLTGWVANRWEGTVEELMNAPSADVMTSTPTVIDDGALARQALETMENHKPRPVFLLPIVDPKGRPVGMVHLHDLVQAGFKTSLNEVDH